MAPPVRQLQQCPGGDLAWMNDVNAERPHPLLGERTRRSTSRGGTTNRSLTISHDRGHYAERTFAHLVVGSVPSDRSVIEGWIRSRMELCKYAARVPTEFHFADGSDDPLALPGHRR